MSEKSAQQRRFEQAARELGVDLDEDKLKDALRRMSGEPAKNENPGHLGYEPPVTKRGPEAEEAGDEPKRKDRS